MSRILKDIKQFINENKLEELKIYYNDLMQYDLTDVALPDLYQKVYIHACLKKRRAIAEWLESLFPKFDPITQIAYRQVFSYGRYLLAR
jgi:hypothetical protein